MFVETEPANFVAGSFRDRAGRVFLKGSHVFRTLSAEGLCDWEKVSAASFFHQGLKEGSIVGTVRCEDVSSIDPSGSAMAILKHDRLEMLTWPWEWSFSMLRDAALAQLELMAAALQEDCILKDATPFNWHLHHGRWSLIDVGSLTPLKTGQVWEGYRQFCEMFLFPLMLQAWKGVDFQPWMRGRLSGIPIRQFASLLSFRDLFRAGALTHVWLHARLQTGSVSAAPVADHIRESGFDRRMICNNVDNLQRLVARLKWNPRGSTWSSYDFESEPVQRDSASKEEFVRRVCAAERRSTVWDLGCNLGRYSEIAAANAQLVLAFDSDHLTVDRLYQRIMTTGIRNVIPLVMDLTDPSPSLGWRLSERPDLSARSTPQLILCLAVMHHLVIGGHLLLDDLVAWLASHQAEVIFEYIHRDDPQTTTLLRNRRDVFRDYSGQLFLEAVHRHFVILSQQVLPSGTRTLYHLLPVSSAVHE